jgi:hypothetical protein
MQKLKDEPIQTFRMAPEESIVESTIQYVEEEGGVVESYKSRLNLVYLLDILSPACLLLLFFAFSSFNVSSQWITVPLQFLPVQTFTTTITVVPTGKNVVPATSAHGTITVYNGSLLRQQLRQTVLMVNGAEFITDGPVTIPASQPPALGVVTVSAHAVASGQIGNIGAKSINVAYSDTITMQNLTPFTGGADEQTTTYATDNDKSKALSIARATLDAKAKRYPAMLDGCSKTSTQNDLTLSAVWSCRFARYHVDAGVHVRSWQRVDSKHVRLEIGI